MAAAFTFDRYQIKDLVYNLDDSKEPTIGEREINFNIAVLTDNDNHDRFRVELKTVVLGNPTIDLVILGYFTSTGYYKEEEVIESVKMVGASILYPYSRSIVSMISVQDGNHGIILPTLNLVELFSKENLDEVKKDGLPIASPDIIVEE